MDLLGMIFGWNWKVRRTRRKWDRLREDALKKEGHLRKTLLEKLDHTEETLRIIEERKLSRKDRQRNMKIVKSELNYIKDLLEGKIIEQEMIYRKEDYKKRPQMRPQAPQQARQYGRYPYPPQKKKE
jgi:hypothetical protein